MYEGLTVNLLCQWVSLWGARGAVLDAITDKPRKDNLSKAWCRGQSPGRVSRDLGSIKR